MFGKSGIAHLVFFISALVSMSATAYEARVCNSCGTPAMQFQARDSGNGDYYFYDFTYRKLTHLQVRGITVPMIMSSHIVVGNGGGTVVSVPITAAEQLDFNAAQAFVDSNGGATDYSIDVAVDLTASVSAWSAQRAGTARTNSTGQGSVNAFDIVSMPLARTVVGNWLNKNSFVLGMQIGVATFLNYGLNNAIIKSPINVYTRVNFPDHTSAIYVWDFDFKGFVYVPGTAKDSLEQHIPESAVDAAGGPYNSQEYIYPSTPNGASSGTHMVDRLNQLGMGLGYPAPSSGGYRIACVNAGNGTHCEIWLIGS